MDMIRFKKRKKPTDLSPKTISAYRWREKNPQAYLAECLAKRFPVQCEVEYVCPHEGPKVNHHPDFNDPFLIQKLCQKCHRQTMRFKNGSAGKD